ncbi:hypothetical protein D3C72_1487350 [compost metagenome]
MFKIDAAEHAESGQRIAKAHLRARQRFQMRPAAHIHEERTKSEVDRRDVGSLGAGFAEDVAEGIDGRMRAAAGGIRLERRPLDLPVGSEPCGKLGRVAGAAHIAAEEPTPGILEDLRGAGETGGGQIGGKQATFGCPAGMNLLRLAAVVIEGP